MSLSPENRLQRIEDCREIYLKYGGEQHELIEREMRALGHRDFHRRSMYRRYERGTCKEGWIGRYGWERLVKMQNAQCRVQNESKEQSVPARGNSDSYRWSEAEPVVRPASQPSVCNTRHIVGEQSGYGEFPNSNLQPPATASGSDLSDFDEFRQWLKAVSPSMKWEWRHQVYIYRRLKRVSDGLCKRLMIFLPPRHGKSELVTVRYAAYRLKQDPTLNVILGSYNQRLANRFSRKVRRVLTDDAARSAGIPAGMDAEASGPENAASPLYVRKSYAFPAGSQKMDCGCAAGGKAPELFLRLTESLRLSAHRAAKPTAADSATQQTL